MTKPTTRAEANAAARKPIPWYIIRRWVYAVAIATGGILVYHRVIPPEALAVYLPLVLALFNTKPPATPDES